MTPEHDAELGAQYVFGALDRDERDRFEAHLAGCTTCADEVRSLQRVMDALARTVPQHSPPPELRARVIAAAIAAAGAQVPKRSMWRVLAGSMVAVAILTAALYAAYASRR